MVNKKPAKSQPRQGLSRGTKGGFTMVEIIIAIVILAFGLMGMAGATALFVRQTTLAAVTTKRSAALQTTLERLRALPFDSVSTGSDSVGLFSVQWTVTTFENQWKVVDLITTGPGMARSSGFPMLTASVPDTFTYRIIRP